MSLTRKELLALAGIVIPVTAVLSKPREKVVLEPLHPNLYYWRAPRPNQTSGRVQTEVCIYGGTAAGLIAAVQLRKMGRAVIVVNPAREIGGMTTGGLL